LPRRQPTSNRDIPSAEIGGPELDLSVVATVVDRIGSDDGDLIPILQQVQDRLGYLPEPVVDEVARLTGIPASRIYGVITFYGFLTERRQGACVIRLCRSLSCDMLRKDAVARRLESELGIDFGETTADGAFTLEWTNCLGMCDQGPALLANDRVFTRVDADRVPLVLDEIRRAAIAVATDPGDQASRVTTAFLDTPTFAMAAPEAGLRAALSLSSRAIIELLSASGLKGRGGAGFVTGVKWGFAAAEQREPKYVVCNADEGEPGTFKDRVILSEFTDLMLDGMTIAARAVGAAHGLIYLRGEYAFLLPHLQAVLARRRTEGLLGAGIFGDTGRGFDVSVFMGSGAYICGEETALLESVEGRRGLPRKRPPFPPVSGLWQRPTVIDNVETFAWTACILARGAEWFRSLGTEVSRGSKLFSVSGDCAAPGVYEFPFGTTLSELLDRVGGAGAKAVQVGGAAGICVPAVEFARSLAFEDVTTGGSVIVLGQQRDVVLMARNFLSFFVDESCGKCVPCRIGTRRMYEILDRIVRGEAESSDIDKLERLAEVVKRTSFCGLGQTAANPVLSTLRHFRHEYEARIGQEGSSF
jgi:[NiFe] hydrogenase diaphorase moiety large subunit